MRRRFNERADDCLGSAGEGESEVGVTEREEFEESWGRCRGRLGDEMRNDEPYKTQLAQPPCRLANFSPHRIASSPLTRRPVIFV